jgi:hypothetical protein
MKAEKIVKSSQEQAVAAWINYLNQVRLDRLVKALSKQDINLATAMETIENAFRTIKDEIVFRNRGGDKGMHGFIAEIAECGIGNARQQIIGKASIYTWINDNGPDDLIRGAEAIQQKFVQSGGHLSLRAVVEHLHHYPEYLAEGHKYQIPRDHYEKIMAYLEMPAEVANKLPTSTGEFSLRQWKEVHAFFKDNNIDPSKLEPSILEYGEVQQGTIGTTFDKEKDHLREVDQEQRDLAYQESKPTFAEGVKATAISAVIEGATTFVMAVYHKRKEGKKIKDFDQADWLEITGESGKGTFKGGIRGASIYLLTNFTATPAAVASAITTAAFGVAEQAHLLRSGTINEAQFIENAEMLCLDASVSALSSFAGQVLIPVPVLGAVIGNAIGTMLYQIAKDSLSVKEKAIIEKYLKDISDLDVKLAEDYKQYIEKMNHCFAEYMDLLTVAFNPEVEKALDGSVALAKHMGVPTGEILDSYDKIASYFLD